MSSSAAIVYQDGRYPFAATAAQEPGDVLVRPCGTLAIYDSLYRCACGERIDPQPVHPALIASFSAPPDATWSAGAILYWDATNNVVTTASTANKRVGLATADKSVGQTSALVNCVPADADPPVQSP